MMSDYIPRATPAVVIDTDDTLAADSDAKVPSQKAVKAYVDANAGGGAPTTGIVLLSSTTVNLNDDNFPFHQALYTVPAGKNAIIVDVVLHHFSDAPANATLDIFVNGVSITNSVDLGGGLEGSAASMVLSLRNFEPTVIAKSYFMAPYQVAPAESVVDARLSELEGSPLTCQIDVFGYLTNTSGVPQTNLSAP